MLQKDYNPYMKLKLLNNLQAKKNFKGIVCIIIAALCFSIMSAFLKLIIDQHHVLDIMFLRSAFDNHLALLLVNFFYSAVLIHFRINYCNSADYSYLNNYIMNE